MSKFGDYKVIRKVYTGDIYVDGIIAEVYDELWSHGDTKFTIARGMCDYARVSPKSVEFFKSEEEAMAILGSEEEARKKAQEKSRLLIVLNSGNPSWKIIGNVQECNNYLIVTNANFYEFGEFLETAEVLTKNFSKIVIPKQSVAFTVVQ